MPVPPAEDLGGHVVGRADDVAQPLVLPRVGAQTKVDHLDRRLVVLGRQQEVLRLQVPVDHALAVEVPKCVEHRARAARGAPLAELAVARDRLEELPALAELDDEVDRLFFRFFVFFFVFLGSGVGRREESDRRFFFVGRVAGRAASLCVSVREEMKKEVSRVLFQFFKAREKKKTSDLDLLSPRKKKVLFPPSQHNKKTKTHPVVLVGALKLDDRRVVEAPHDRDLPSHGRHSRRRRELALEDDLARKELAGVPAGREPRRAELAPPEHAPEGVVVRDDGEREVRGRRRRLVRFVVVLEDSENERRGGGWPGEGAGV